MVTLLDSPELRRSNRFPSYKLSIELILLLSTFYSNW
jgi:hypothetical protein